MSLRLKSIEDALGVTGKELARICGVSDNTIYRIEGRTKSDAAISEKSLITICEKTGVDPDWLLDFNSELTDSIEFSDFTVSQRFSASSGSSASVASDDGETDGKKGGTGAGERLKQLRSELGLSQDAFSKMIGTSRANLASIETGRNRLMAATAKKIENACEHGGAEWLLTGNERNRHYPVGDEMIEWFMNHQEEREKIWKKMRETEDFEEVYDA